VDALSAALKGFDLEPRCIWHPAERRALLADGPTLARCRCLVSAGGDGSLGDVVNELAELASPDAAPLVPLAVGNENLFARQFAYPDRPAELARVIGHGRPQRLDAATVGGRWFTLMASAGLDADVVHRMAAWRQAGETLRRVRRVSYLGRILASIRGYGYPTVRLEADDGRVAEGAHAFAFNLPQYGMNLGIAPDADGADGMLDWVVFERRGLMSLLRYGAAVVFHRHRKLPGVHTGRAASLRLTGDPAGPVQADGDPAGHLPLELETRPGALRLLTPPEAVSR